MIPRRTPADVERIRAACAIVHEVQQALEAAVVPGVTTLALDHLAEAEIRGRGGVPAFKGYHGFPASICTSVNDEAVHGFPRSTPLRVGDLLSVDVGVCCRGWYGDGAFTVVVGDATPDIDRLLTATRAALEAGIAAARPGHRVSDISHAIETAAAAGGLSVVREYGGHGIGRALHEDPHILNYGRPGRGARLQVGHVFAIEPILSLGRPEVRTADDGWTALTCDGSPVAHFEHTVAVTPEGPDVLTLPASRPAVRAAG